MPNKLSQAHSPYLLQHKDNPVDWYEWSDETFALAKQENKPIFLSIGYSTCHWCHVMAHESFEDDETAALMNDTFINIKVDREERPDIDTVYMDVCQTMTGHGGWPLTIIMTPDKKPFYSATYIPKTDRGERVGMQRLTAHVKASWANEKDKLLKAADEITSYMQSQKLAPAEGAISVDIVDQAATQFKQRFDTVHGGFGDNPKFPSPHNLLFLLRYSAVKKDDSMLYLATETLDHMRLGGMWDHIGFGFHRYSTDKEWLLPHFEKMLYDQALLLYAYAEAYQRTNSPRYKETALEIVDYLKDKLLSEEGGFYSAEDADSEGVEGKFYVWETVEIEKILSEEEANFFAETFHFEKEGNFRDEQSHQFTGKNIPHLQSFLSETDKNAFKAIREKLYKEREKRVYPSLDDKILSDWNGLAIAALAKAARAFDDTELLSLALQANNFILSKLGDKNGKLLKRYRKGFAGLPAHLNDYAAVIWANIELYLTSQDGNCLKKAIDLTETAKLEFWDEEQGGYFFTAHSSEELINRPKELYDGAIPSGNSLMAFNLNQLFSITGKINYQNNSKLLEKQFASYLKQHPTGASMFLLAHISSIISQRDIIVLTEKSDRETEQKLGLIKKVMSSTDILQINPNTELIPFAKQMQKVDQKSTIYICENFSCRKAITALAELKAALEA